MSPEGADAPRGVLACLILIALAALGVRAVGIDFGIPVWEEPDAVIAMHVDKLRAGDDSTDRRWSDQNYPHLIAQLVRMLPAVDPAAAGPTTRDGHLAAAARTHLQVRWVVALLSLLALPGTWWLTRRFAGPGPALLATALMATSLLHFSFSQQGRPHAAAGGLFVLAVVAAMRLARRGGLADHVLAALAAAAAVGTLQSGAAVLPALALGYWLRPGPSGWRRVFDGRALIHLGALALALRALYPFLFAGAQEGAAAVDGEAVTLAEHSVTPAEFLDGGGFGVVLESLWNYDPVLLALSLLGAVVWLFAGLPGWLRGLVGGWQRDPAGAAGAKARELAVALAFALPYLLVIGMFAKTYERFAIPLLPFLAAAAGAGVGRFASRGRPKVWLAVAGLLALLPAATCAKLALLRSRPDTLDLAAAWIEANLEPSDSIAMPTVPRMNTSFELPLVRREDTLRHGDGKRIKQHSPWGRYQLKHLGGPGARDGGDALDALDVLDGRGALDDVERRWALRWLAPKDKAENQLLARDYEAFILSMAPGYLVVEPFVERFDQPLFVDLTRIVSEHGERVARFTPEGPDGKIEWPLFYMLSDHFNDAGYEAWPHFVPRLLRASAIGPAVEIYRMEGGR